MKKTYPKIIKGIYQGVKEANEIASENVIDINETAFAPDKVLKRADEQLKWQKTFKRRKNKLHRLVNKLKIWDYSFTESMNIEKSFTLRLQNISSGFGSNCKREKFFYFFKFD